MIFLEIFPLMLGGNKTPTFRKKKCGKRRSSHFKKIIIRQLKCASTNLTKTLKPLFSFIIVVMWNHQKNGESRMCFSQTEINRQVCRKKKSGIFKAITSR